MIETANPQSENHKLQKHPAALPPSKNFAGHTEPGAPVSDIQRGLTRPQPPLGPRDLLALQQTIGNQAVQRLLAHEERTAESSGQKAVGSSQPLVQRQPFAAVRGVSMFLRPSQVNRQSDRGAARTGTAGQPIAAVRQAGRIQRVDLSQPTEVEALLTELAEAEAASGVSSGRTERVKKHLQTLKPTELVELGQALDVVEHYIEAKKDELENVGEKTEEHAKKKLAMFKAKLLLQLVEGDIELADVQQLMGKKEAKKDKSEDVDLEGSDVEDLNLDEDSPVTGDIQYAAEDILDPDLEPAALSKRWAEDLVQKGLFDLKAEIDKADAILPQAHL